MDNNLNTFDSTQIFIEFLKSIYTHFAAQVINMRNVARIETLAQTKKLKNLREIQLEDDEEEKD